MSSPADRLLVLRYKNWLFTRPEIDHKDTMGLKEKHRSSHKAIHIEKQKGSRNNDKRGIGK